MLSQLTKVNSNEKHHQILIHRRHLNPIIDSIALNNTIYDFTKKDQLVNAIIRKKQTKIDLVRYLYAVYIFPTISIFTKVIANNNFST